MTDREHDLAALRSALACASLPESLRTRFAAEQAEIEGAPGTALSRASRDRLHAALVKHVYAGGVAPAASPAERFPLRAIPRRSAV